MAEFGKKIYLKNSAGAQQTAKIYSTTGESQTPYFPLVVDGVQGYATLVSTSDSRATSGRVKHSNGNTYAIGTMGVVPYGSQLITAVGGGTFTVPSGVTKLRVTCVGGGASGCGDELTGSAFTHSGNAGGISTFGSVGANGGTAPRVSARARDDGEGYYWSEVTSYTISYGYTNGQYVDNYSAAVVQGASAVPITNIFGSYVGAAGAGGAVGFKMAGGYHVVKLTGASGYITVNAIAVTSGSTISYNVGAGGAVFKTSYFYTPCTAGGSGAIFVEWGQGIQ